MLHARVNIGRQTYFWQRKYLNEGGIKVLDELWYSAERTPALTLHTIIISYAKLDN